MNIIGSLIDKGIISPAMGRSIEVFLVSNLITLLISVLEAFQLLLSEGESIDWQLILGSFVSSILISLVSGLRKYIRDLSK